jgi:hypothetical protein
VPIFLNTEIDAVKCLLIENLLEAWNKANQNIVFMFSTTEKSLPFVDGEKKEVALCYQTTGRSHQELSAKTEELAESLC